MIGIYQWPVTWFSGRPMPSIWVTTVSPPRRKTGSLRGVDDASRRAGRDQVAQVQTDHGRDVPDQVDRVEEQVSGDVLLHHLVVNRAPNVERWPRPTDLGRLDQPGADRRGGSQFLPCSHSRVRNCQSRT